MLVLVMDADVLTDLYLDKLQLRFRNDRMPAAGGHGNHISHTDHLFLNTDNRTTGTLNDCPQMV